MPARVKALVQARDLEKRYVDGPRVVSVLGGLDLDVEPGERIAIVGESGVGKMHLDFNAAPRRHSVDSEGMNRSESCHI
jgi:predicted ABC-type transport system involved in lysophospholipase L1 biosynthesis ATPase subunit